MPWLPCLTETWMPRPRCSVVGDANVSGSPVISAWAQCNLLRHEVLEAVVEAVEGTAVVARLGHD